MARNDEEIKQDVLEQLLWDSRIDASDISVDVSNGVVTLRGTVPTYLSRSAAFSNTWNIVGVTGVHNELSVRYPARVAVPTDEEMERHIQNILQLDPDIDAMNIEVNVESGEVTLNGSVEAFWQKQHVEDLIAGHRGVLRIRDNLSVVPTNDYMDLDIAKAIVAALDRNVLVNAEEIDVRVKDSAVTLSGTVPNWQARRAAYEAALYTPGVAKVKNNINVSSGRARTYV